MDDDFTFQINLPIYQGPLDLLLHLININEIDIYNIPISQITSEYLGYISFMRELNLEVVSEFLLMAATLIYIKSKMLLPKPPTETEEDDELDPRAELVDLLLEHQKFKRTAKLLKQREKERQQVWTRGTSEGEESEEGIKVDEVSVFDLITAMRKVLQQREEIKPINLKKKDFSLEEKIEELMETITEEKKLIFSSFFSKFQSKIEIIIFFLALLEIVRRGAVKIYQEKPLGEIIIVRLEVPYKANMKSISSKEIESEK